VTCLLTTIGRVSSARWRAEWDFCALTGQVTVTALPDLLTRGRPVPEFSPGHEARRTRFSHRLAEELIAEG